MPARAQKPSKTALLPSPADLRLAAQQASSRGEPLVLMVSLPGCPWCELLRRNYLTPMRAEGVAAFEFMITERSQRIADFKGQSITPAAWSEAMKIKITPTLLFFNAQGQEIAPRIEGVASADFVGAIIDERLATAREIIKAAR
jgi:thioredoxin-related protein